LQTLEIMARLPNLRASDSFVRQMGAKCCAAVFRQRAA
jgi:hypothetical protein